MTENCVYTFEVIFTSARNIKTKLIFRNVSIRLIYLFNTINRPDKLYDVFCNEYLKLVNGLSCLTQLSIRKIKQEKLSIFKFWLLAMCIELVSGSAKEIK